MANNIIPFNAHHHSREILQESFIDINNRIIRLAGDMKATGIVEHPDRFLARCDELRSQLSEAGDIFRRCAQLRLVPDLAGAMESLRILHLMISHIELMFLYARKNPESAQSYQKEINLTANDFFSRHTRLTKSIAWL